MSYYPNRDGLRCDRCLCQTTKYLKGPNNTDLCDQCWEEYLTDRRGFYLTWLVVAGIICAALWVLYSLPPTFD